WRVVGRQRQTDVKVAELGGAVHLVSRYAQRVGYANVQRGRTGQHTTLIIKEHRRNLDLDWLFLQDQLPGNERCCHLDAANRPRGAGKDPHLAEAKAKLPAKLAIFG